MKPIVGKKTEFARTPQFKSGGKKDTFRRKEISQQSRLDALFAEVFSGLYFAATVVYAITTKTTPNSLLLSLLGGAYLYTGSCRSGQILPIALRRNAPKNASCLPLRRPRF